MTCLRHKSHDPHRLRCGSRQLNHLMILQPLRQCQGEPGGAQEAVKVKVAVFECGVWLAPLLTFVMGFCVVCVSQCRTVQHVCVADLLLAPAAMLSRQHARSCSYQLCMIIVTLLHPQGQCGQAGEPPPHCDHPHRAPTCTTGREEGATGQRHMSTWTSAHRVSSLA